MIDFTVGLLTNVRNDLEEWSGNLSDQIKRVTIAYQQTKTNLETSITFTQNQIKQILEELTAADKVLSINEKREKNFKDQIKKNNETITSLKAEISSLNAQKSAAETDKSSFDSQILNLRSKINKLESENEELHKKINLIHENKEKLFSIKSSLRTSKEKCESHLAKLKDSKFKLNDSYSYFIDHIVSYVMNKVNDEIIPKMERVISAGTALVSGLIELGDLSGSNVYNVTVSISSGSVFRSQASNLDRKIDIIKSKTEYSTRSTNKFKNGLNDRVSLAASKIVSDINKGINDILSNSLKGYVSKLQHISSLCDSYENIYLNA